MQRRVRLSNSVTTTVFANGIWKSGTNLLAKLCVLLGVPRANLGIASSLLIGKWYPVRQLIRGPKWERFPIGIGIDLPINVSATWLRRSVKRCRGQCIGGHAAYSDHLLWIFKSEEVRPIQIVRDPRDVIVSFCHWIDTQPDYYAYPAFEGLSLSERMLAVIQGIRHGKLHLDSFAKVLDRSYGWLTRPEDVLLVRFEDLVGAEGGGSRERQIHAVRRISEWLGIERVDPAPVSDSLFGGTSTFRQGIIGSWRKEFTVEVKQEFDRIVGERLKHWGYEG